MPSNSFYSIFGTSSQTGDVFVENTGPTPQQVSPQPIHQGAANGGGLLNQINSWAETISAGPVPDPHPQEGWAHQVAPGSYPQPFGGFQPATPQPVSPPNVNAQAFNVANIYLTSFGVSSHSGWSNYSDWCDSHGINAIEKVNSWDYAVQQYSSANGAGMPIGKTETTRPDFLDTNFKRYFGNKRIKACKGEIGLEIEAEGKNLFNSPIQYWNAVSDGSLRNYEGHPPLEYVLREPVRREEVGDALKYLADRLKGAKSELHMSHRCSVHVHVNAQQMTMRNLINYMCLYFIFEDILVHWAAAERKGNLFCLRAKDAEFQITLLKNAIKDGDFSGIFDKEFRYSAMNYSALGEHGSLEFRAMKGTVDTKTIANWVSILLALKDAAESFKNPATISRMFQSLGPSMFFNKVFTGRIDAELRAELKAAPEFHKVLWDAFRVMRDICHAVDWDNPPKWMVGSEIPKKVVKKPMYVVSSHDESEW